MPRQKKPRRYNAGLYNLKVGRNQKVVRDFLIWLLTMHRIKVLLCQEASGYRNVLDDIPGYTCFQRRSAADSSNVAILVADELVSRFRFVRTMKRRWWGAKNNRWRAPRSYIAVRAGGVLWFNVHRVAYQSHTSNTRANRELDRNLVKDVRARPRARICVGGDFNDGVQSPEIQKIRQRTGLKPCSAGGIDYFLFCDGSAGEGFRVYDAERIENDGGSDHHPKKCKVEWSR